MMYMYNSKTTYCQQNILLYFLSLLVIFDSKERCLSLQCFEDYKRFIPQKCSNPLDRVCANMSEFFLVKLFFLFMHYMTFVVIKWNLQEYR